MTATKVITTDVLIIGGGGTAARAALEAAKEGVQVTMVMKGTFLHTGATAYKASEMAGFNAGDGAADPNDSPEEHYKDIMAAADGMSIPSLSRIVAYEAVNTLNTLDAWGVTFEKDGNSYLAIKSCFSKRPRTHIIKGHGEPILYALDKQLKKRNVGIIENVIITGLLVQDNICSGALMLDETGMTVVIEAKSVIIATGGAGQIFEKNLNPKDVTGDGYAMGFRAGAELINMEFMQAGIGISHPITSLLNAYIWSGLPKITNKNHEDFLSRELPSGITIEKVMNEHSNHFPFSCSDNSYLLEVLIQKQILKGNGTPEGGIYMDLTHMTDEYVNSIKEDSGLRKMWHIAREYYESHNVHIMSEPVQIACFAHAINGGLLINEKAQTTIEGLFAAGETAGGPHGADRLGGNMLLTCQIYGAIAGKEASKRAKNLSKQNTIASGKISEKIDAVNDVLYRKLDNDMIQKQLKVAAQNYLLVCRTEKGLKSLIDLIDELRNEIVSAPRADMPDIKNLETDNLLTAAELMANSAILRRESRGAHYRVDCPEKNDADFGRPIVIFKNKNMISSRFLKQ